MWIRLHGWLFDYMVDCLIDCDWKRWMTASRCCDSHLTVNYYANMGPRIDRQLVSPGDDWLIDKLINGIFFSLFNCQLLFNNRLTISTIIS